MGLGGGQVDGFRIGVEHHAIFFERALWTDEPAQHIGENKLRGPVEGMSEATATRHCDLQHVASSQNHAIDETWKDFFVRPSGVDCEAAGTSVHAAVDPI